MRADSATEAITLDRDIGAETLKMDDSAEYDSSGNEVYHNWQTVVPEGSAKGTALVVPEEMEAKEGDYVTFKPRPATDVDGGRRKCCPYDIFAKCRR